MVEDIRRSAQGLEPTDPFLRKYDDIHPGCERVGLHRGDKCIPPPMVHTRTARDDGYSGGVSDSQPLGRPVTPHQALEGVTGADLGPWEFDVSVALIGFADGSTWKLGGPGRRVTVIRGAVHPVGWKVGVWFAEEDLIEEPPAPRVWPARHGDCLTEGPHSEQWCDRGQTLSTAGAVEEDPPVPAGPPTTVWGKGGQVELANIQERLRKAAKVQPIVSAAQLDWEDKLGRFVEKAYGVPRELLEPEPFYLALEDKWARARLRRLSMAANDMPVIEATVFGSTEQAWLTWDGQKHEGEHMMPCHRCWEGAYLVVLNQSGVAKPRAETSAR